MIQLRNYQTEAKANVQAALATHRRALFTMPTGAGKTIVFVAVLLEHVKRGGRALVLVHRQEILRQTVEQLVAAGFSEAEVGIIWRKHPERLDAPVQVASIRTLQAQERAAHKPLLLTGSIPMSGLSDPPPAGLVVIDEAHHTPTLFASAARSYPSAKILGVTATPARLDGRPLGEWFDVLVTGERVESLIENDWLAEPEVWSHPEVEVDLRGIRKHGHDFDQRRAAERMRVIVGSLPDQYRKHANDLPTACFAVNRMHGEAIVERFREHRIAAEVLTGKMRPRQRADVLQRLLTGKTKVVVTCDVISEGFDMPAVRAVIMARPTMSETVALQQAGRCMRPGHRAVIIDHAGNFKNRFDLPSISRDWSLETDRPKPVRRCDMREDGRLTQRSVAEVAGDLERLVGPLPRLPCTTCGAPAERKSSNHARRAQSSRAYCEAHKREVRPVPMAECLVCKEPATRNSSYNAHFKGTKAYCPEHSPGKKAPVLPCSVCGEPASRNSNRAMRAGRTKSAYCPTHSRNERVQRPPCAVCGEPATKLSTYGHRSHGYKPYCVVHSGKRRVGRSKSVSGART